MSNADGNFSRENEPNNDVSNGDTFSADYSKRGTAKCRKCKRIIAKGILRIGKNAMIREKDIIQYYHIDCAFETFKNAKLVSSTLTNINELDGVEDITEDERIFFDNCIEDGNRTRSDSASQKSEVSRKKVAKFQRVTG